MALQTKELRKERRKDAPARKKGRGWLYFRKDTGRQVCGSPLAKRPGMHCALPGKLHPISGRCKKHGGANGIGRPPSIEGYSARALGPLRARMRELVVDPNLLRVEPQIALLDCVTERLLEMAEAGDGPEFRSDAVKLYDESRDAMASGNKGLAAAKLSALGDHLRSGAARTTALLRAAELADKRANRAQRERKTVSEEARTYTEAAFAVTMIVVANAVLENSPSQTAARVLDAIDRALVAASGPQYPGSEGGVITQDLARVSG